MSGSGPEHTFPHFQIHSLFIHYTAHCSLLHNVCLWAVRGAKFWSNYRVGTDTDLTMDEIILNNDMRIHLRMERKGKIGKTELKTSNRSTRGSGLLFCTVILLLLFILLSPYIIIKHDRKKKSTKF